MDNKIMEDLSNILNNKEELNKFKEFLGVNDDFFKENNNFEKNSNNTQNNSSQNMFGNINLEQLMMFQNMLGGLNSKSDNKSNSLLLSLKPFLSDERQSKVDMAINLLKMVEFMPMINNNLFGGFSNNENR